MNIAYSSHNVRHLSFANCSQILSHDQYLFSIVICISCSVILCVCASFDAFMCCHCICFNQSNFSIAGLLWKWQFSSGMSTWKHCYYWGSTLWPNGARNLHISWFWIFELFQVRHVNKWSATSYIFQQLTFENIIWWRHHIQRKKYSSVGLLGKILSLFLFCSNVLSVLDQRCSGRYACTFKVTELVGYKNTCTTELTSYLQARYTCAPG